MITVSILINGHPIITRSARNIRALPSGQHEYKVDDGRMLHHDREDGAIKLAIMMLDGVQEP